MAKSLLHYSRFGSFIPVCGASRLCRKASKAEQVSCSACAGWMRQHPAAVTEDTAQRAPKPAYPDLTVENQAGRIFFVRIVRQGERYGNEDVLTHDAPDPLIEFYDATPLLDPKTNKFGPRGQFVSRYNRRTLCAHTHAHGLNLQGDEPVWQIDAPAFAPVLEWLRTIE